MLRALMLFHGVVIFFSLFEPIKGALGTSEKVKPTGDAWCIATISTKLPLLDFSVISSQGLSLDRGRSFSNVSTELLAGHRKYAITMRTPIVHNCKNFINKDFIL